MTVSNAVLRFNATQRRGKRMTEAEAVALLIAAGYSRDTRVQSRHRFSRDKRTEEMTWVYSHQDGNTAVLRVRYGI